MQKKSGKSTKRRNSDDKELIELLANLADDMVNQGDGEASIFEQLINQYKQDDNDLNNTNSNNKEK